MTHQWQYRNPVDIRFGPGTFNLIGSLLAGRPYALVTYPGAAFSELVNRMTHIAGAPVLTIDDIAPNPDVELLRLQCQRFQTLPKLPAVIVALGGGSVVDSTKVFAFARGDFNRVQGYLGGQDFLVGDQPLAFIAVPTTAGTGSEVTPWATLWDNRQGKKYSLSHAKLFAETAIIDPSLMLGKPRELTLITAMDSLSHAFESLWNKHANPVSAHHAIAAARSILSTLPALLDDLANPDLRAQLAEASLGAGLAFSNTKTAIAHNLSYPITLRHGVPHGIACSFTLPSVLRSMAGSGEPYETWLEAIFHCPVVDGAERLMVFLQSLGVGHRFTDHGVADAELDGIIDEAFAGERGQNFVGTKECLLEAARAIGSLT